MVHTTTFFATNEYLLCSSYAYRIAPLVTPPHSSMPLARILAPGRCNLTYTALFWSSLQAVNQLGWTVFQQTSRSWSLDCIYRMAILITLVVPVMSVCLAQNELYLCEVGGGQRLVRR